MGFGKRLKALLAEKKKSQDFLAVELGLSQPAVSKWCREESEPDIITIHKIAEILDVSFSDLGLISANNKEMTVKAIRIPICESEASAESGCFNDTEKMENYLMIDRETIRGELQCNPDNLVIIRIRGDSMSPTIKPGEMVVIDKTVNSFFTDGIYVFRLSDETLFVKRIQILPGQKVNVISANAAYPAYQMNLADKDNEGLAVVGRVMAIIAIEKVGI